MERRLQSDSASASANEGAPRTGDEVSHVRRREIQAPLVAALIEGYAEELGRERAVEIAMRVIRADAEASARKLVDEYGDNSIATLARVVREVWCRDDAMVIDVLEETDQRLSFNVTRCGYAEAYERLGIKSLGVCLSCSRDEPFAPAFNPRLRLTRTQTLMERAGHCDFRYALT